MAVKWKAYMNNWKKLQIIFKASSIIDLDLKKSNSVIIKWHYGLLLEALLNYMVYLSQGLPYNSSCSEVYAKYSIGEFFFFKIFPIFFKILPFNYPLGIFILIVDIFINTAWVFNDSFIVLISQSIARSFTVINEKLSRNVDVSVMTSN